MLNRRVTVYVLVVFLISWGAPGPFVWGTDRGPQDSSAGTLATGIISSNSDSNSVSNDDSNSHRRRSIDQSRSSRMDSDKDGGQKVDRRKSQFWSEDIQVGCRELRARRYISDGFCTSEKPIKEVVCAGNCLPIMDLPWYAEFVKYWARTKLKDWQCEEDIVRRKRVKLVCQNGDFRTYRIKVVKSCKCKKMLDQHNRTRVKKSRRKKKRRKGRKNKTSTRGS